MTLQIKLWKRIDNNQLLKFKKNKYVWMQWFKVKKKKKLKSNKSKNKYIFNNKKKSKGKT